MRNPSDFGNVLSYFYGPQNAKKFKDLLSEHLSIAGNLVNAAKNGNNEEVKKYEQDWYANAAEIADFLSSLNPYWKKEDWNALLSDHLNMTEQEAVNRLKGNYAEDIAIYDSIENEALKMADYMADGILNQFGY